MNCLKLTVNQPELFLDPAIIEKMAGAINLHDHQPVEREIVITHDAPWEGPSSTFHTVFKDGDLYRMYYRGSTVKNGEKAPPPHPEYACYAESRDGIHWHKPEIGLIEHEGSTANNIILNQRPACHDFAPFRDDNPDCEVDKRYKAVAKYRFPTYNTFGLQLFHSADGIRWELSKPDPIISDGHFDSLNKVFWDRRLNCYRAYYRDFQKRLGKFSADGTPDGLRAIKTAISSDLSVWTRGEFLTFSGDGPDTELYTNAIMPYYRSPRYYLGFPMRFTRHPDLNGIEGMCDALFMASTDGFHFNRRDEALVRPSPASCRQLHRNNLPANGLVETASSTPGREHELSIYTTERYAAGPGTQLRRRTFRLDGFVSARARMSGGSLITIPLEIENQDAPLTLELNASTSAAGSIRVAIIKSDGREIEGFGLADCEVMRGDNTHWYPSWKQSKIIPKMDATRFHLQFDLSDADLYSFAIVPGQKD